MRYLPVVVFVVCSLYLATLTQHAPRSVTVLGSLGPFIESSLAARGESLEADGGVLTLYVEDESQTVQDLAELYWTLDTRIAVAEQNIANRGIYWNDPYGTHVAVCDPRGTVIGIRNDDSPYKYVYDPTNPRAMRSGRHKGYLCCSNVNVRTEREHIASCRYEQSLLRDMIHRLDPQAILGYERRPPGLLLPPPLPSAKAHDV